MNDQRGYAAKLERDTAARLLKQALSAEDDYSGEENARIARSRIARLNLDALNASGGGILVNAVRQLVPTESVDCESLKKP